MSSYSMGDMAQSQMLSRRNSYLKQQMSQLTEELSSGRTADVARKLSGDYSQLIDIERTMRTLDGFKTAVNEASAYADAMQKTLDHMQANSSAFSSELLASGASNIPQVVDTSAKQAANQLDAMISSLNGQVAGRSLFGGISTDRAPMIDSSTLLNEARNAITAAGAVTFGDIQTAVANWFNNPAGFDAIAYQGSNIALSPFQLGQGEQVSLDIKANDPAIRDLLRHTVLAALSTDSSLGLSLQDQSALMNSSGIGIFEAGRDITGLRANVGAVEAQIDQRATRIAAERTSSEYAKGALLGIDQYEAATRLEEVQFQLESLYSVTVRLSRLSLLNYMQ
ncbi:MAG: flagellin [Paracoccaceae bacterium]